MKKQNWNPLRLENGARIVVLGGGPAGAFFAIHLLRSARSADLDITVTIIDERLTLDLDGNIQVFKGCNFCAGVISPRLQEALAEYDIILPQEVVAESFFHIWIHGFWKNFPLRVPVGQRLFSVFRGSLPPDRKELSQGASRGFDEFILRRAVGEGAKVIAGEVLEIHQSSPPFRNKKNLGIRNHRGCLGIRKPYLTIKTSMGDFLSIESEFVCICTGVNHNREKNKENSFWKSYRQINPLFTPPVTNAALIFELKPGREYLKKYMDRELYIIISGAGSLPLHLDHVALIPKGEYLTVALAGKSVDKALSPEETDEIIQSFFSLPHIQTILPHISIKATYPAGQNHENPENKIPGISEVFPSSGTLITIPVACKCNPHMAVTPAKEPFSDRIAMAGDSLGSRIYRDGLFSAFISARALAGTIIHKGVDKKSLSQGYGRVLKWLERDNFYGRLVMGATQTILSSPLLSRILYQAFATEMKFKEKNKWPLGSVLWKVGSGSADYRDICRDIFSPAVFFSILTGIHKTIRNILTEIFFGLSWGNRGRYPTVIIKEKRDYFKKSIAEPLGIELDASPEMERMYAIKIRASAGRIFQELSKFGHPEGKFLKLRFVAVTNLTGKSLRQGAVVRYRLKGLPISMDIRLVKILPGKALLYEPAELFTKRGKLIFDIAPTRDGNHRLIIYTAFNFQKGKTFFGRLFWTVFKHLFPDYAHDVVWNHAICTIKGEAEGNG